MFGIGITEVIMILVVALLVVGPKKLPELAKTLGRGMAEFRRTADDFKASVYQDDEFTEKDRIRADEQRKVSKIQYPEDPPAPASSESAEKQSSENTLAENSDKSENVEAGS